EGPDLPECRPTLSRECGSGGAPGPVLAEEDAGRPTEEQEEDAGRAPARCLEGHRGHLRHGGVEMTGQRRAALRNEAFDEPGEAGREREKESDPDQVEDRMEERDR